MKTLSKILLVWIVAWKVVVMDEGVKVTKHRVAKFQDKATAVAFMKSQPGHVYTLAKK